MKKILEINQLTKHFGRITAVDHLDLQIEEGQVFGILGPNGSGKTTTLGMILDVVAPSDGQFSWFDNIPGPEARKNIGSILETPCFYPYLSAVQNLRIVGHIKDNKNSDDIDRVLEQVNLTERKDDKFKAYSLGMKQRLSIAAALLADPPVLILDEPTNGLDPEGIAEVRQLIRQIAADGKTIIIASHLLDEVQKVCTHFCVLRKGKKLYQGVVAEILEETNQVEIEGEDVEATHRVLSEFPGLMDQKLEGTSTIVSLKQGFTSADLNGFFHDKGISLKKILPIRNTLEDEFLKILKEHD